jgi:hypothetical protein
VIGRNYVWALISFVAYYFKSISVTEIGRKRGSIFEFNYEYYGPIAFGVVAV